MSEQEEDEFFSSESDSAPEETSVRPKSKKIKRKHAPKEASAKKRVSKVRDIPGLKIRGGKSMYRDIRFDPAYGKVNYERIRKDYGFLDEYRKQEIGEMDKMLKDSKMMSRMDDEQIEDLKYRNQSLKSRLGHLKEEEFEKEAIIKYKKETGKKWLKHGEQRKVIKVAKFESMSTRQRRKAIERRRKRKLGKEMKSFAFSK